MTKERWELLEELFHAALDRPESERKRFLDEACGSDHGLRSEVESLLGSDPHTGPETPEDFSPIADRVRRAAVLVACPPRQGDRIGHYRVAEEIGHGGMGLVYRATRADQEFHMQVAIKVAKTGMAAATVLERFRRERQILASLDHRYVAKLLDGGTTSEGLPYFVMEYVEGQPIHKYARAKGLSVRERLQLFRGVLEAVSYAHQNLVVHLDLKPSNILIAADGTPKLLDFGIARLLEDAPATSPQKDSNGGPISTPTGTTAFGRLLTPDYASPEQIRGEAVTTATDVYSLGAVLYQLLTGELPHQLEGLGPRQVERVICALDVVRPSERNAVLRGELAGDLDTIVLKAMAKDVARRYRTAQELDEELRRYLDGLPVRARAGSQFYSLKKFVWRNRLAAAAVTAIFASLVGVIVVTRTEARWAETQRAAAERERGHAEVNAAAAQRNAEIAAANAEQAKTATARTEAALIDAEDARREAVAQRKLAEQGFEEARKLSDSYLFDFNDALQDYPGTLPLRRRMVDRGIAALDKLAQQTESSGQVHADLASAYGRYGDLLGNPDMPNLGDTKAAMESYRKALAMVEALNMRETGHGEYLMAEMDLHRRIGEVLLATGSGAEAVAQWDEAVKYARLALKTHSGDLRFDKEIGNILTGYTHALIDVQPQKALAVIAENGPILARMTEAHPEDADFPSWRATDLSSKGRIAGRLGQLKEAKEAYQAEIALLEELDAKHPHDAVRTRLLMLGYSHLGDVLGNPQLPNLGDGSGAIAAYEKMSRIADASAGDAQNTTAQLDAAMSAGRLGGLRLGQGDAAGALPALEKSVAGLERLVAKDPNNRSFARYYGANLELLGDAQEQLGRKADAVATYGKEIGMSEKVMRLDPTDATSSANFLEGHLKSALLLAQSTDDAALAHLEPARNEAQRQHEAHPQDVRAAMRWVRCLAVEAVVFYRLGNLKQAREELQRAEEVLASIPADKQTALAPHSLEVVADARKLLGPRE